MAYNRKMRKFEGTCYIPGEQLAMMAKYYRGANLNLNLTLFEDDLATMQETFDQACWCSKLDDLDRMKMAHMKGNEWRLAHEHCVDRQGPDGTDPQAHPALLQNSKSTVSKVERGTSAVSLYDRERGVARGGQYHRDDYLEWQSRRGDNYDRTYERNEPRNRRGYYPDQNRDDYKVRYPRDDYPGSRAYPAPPVQNQLHPVPPERTGRNMGGPADDSESDAPVSSIPMVIGEVRCAVCNTETCFVCKNHINSTMCTCKCRVANAGLCNRCSPCEEDEQEAQECADNKVDLSSMMLTMMMSSMFKQSQCPEPVCCCKPSRDNSDSSSTDSSDEKVHKVYLYDCEGTKKNRPFRITSKKRSSDTSSACDCCKCSRKPKKPPGKAGKPPKSKGEETSESDRGQKPNQRKKKEGKGKGSYYIGGESNSEHDVKPSKENNKKSGFVDKASTSSREDSRKSMKSDNMEPSKMKDHKSNTRGTKGPGIDSRNIQLAKKPDEHSQSPRNFPPKQSDAKLSELTSTPDLEGNSEGRDDSRNLREFIVCLPKIQSHLQSLMCKLNQMSHLNQEQYPQLDTIMKTSQCHPERSQAYPTLISQHQNPPHSLYRGEQNEYDSGISPKLSPGNLHVQVLPPSTSQRVSNEKENDETNLNSPARYHSFENIPHLGMKVDSIEKATCEKQQTSRIPELSGSTKQTQPAFKFSPVVGSHEKSSWNKNGNPRSFKEEKQIVHHPASMAFPNIYQHAQRSYLKGTYQNVEIIELCDTDDRNQRNDQVREQAKPNSVASRFGRETIYQSYNRESSDDTTELVPTEYASFAEEKTLQESPESSELQTTCLRKDLIVDKSKNRPSQVHNDKTTISKCSPSKCEEKTSDNTRSILKTPKVVTVKAKQRDQISLEKLLHKYSVNGDGGSVGGEKINVSKRETVDSSEPPAVFDQGVGPGKFCRSKSDSSLDYSKTDKGLPSQGGPETSKGPTSRNILFTDTLIADVPLKKGFSSVEEKAGYTEAIKKKSVLPKTKDPELLDTDVRFKYIPPDCIEEQTDSTLKMSDAYVRQEVGMGVVSSVEVKTINRSTTDILKMVHGIASSSLMNTTNSSVPCPTAVFTSGDFSILPLLPVSSTSPGDASDSRSENHFGDANVKEQVSFKNEISPNTPAFLRKSRVQVEQLKKAHDTIRSMIRNVNDVIAHIDSDSKIGIKSKARNEGSNRLSYFVDQEGVDKKRQSQFKSQDTRNANVGRFEGRYETATIWPSSSSDIQNREVQKMFMSVDRVLNSALTPSDQSSTIPEDHWQFENATPTRAQRDYFILDSESSGAAFTESLRRSLEKETSRSLPIAALRIPSSQLIGPSERLRFTRPLKRRSWCYLPSKK